VDRLELMQMLLGHPEADVRVDLGEFLLDVRNVRYSSEREAVVLLLYQDDVRDVLCLRTRNGEASAVAEPRRA
jgi:hypothetical protein